MINGEQIDNLFLPKETKVNLDDEKSVCKSLIANISSDYPDTTLSLTRKDGAKVLLLPSNIVQIYITPEGVFRINAGDMAPVANLISPDEIQRITSEQGDKIPSYNLSNHIVLTPEYDSHKGFSTSILLSDGSQEDIGSIKAEITKIPLTGPKGNEYREFLFENYFDKAQQQSWTKPALMHHLERRPLLIERLKKNIAIKKVTSAAEKIQG